jgi:hypothetical protein
MAGKGHDAKSGGAKCYTRCQNVAQDLPRLVHRAGHGGLEVVNNDSQRLRSHLADQAARGTAIEPDMLRGCCKVY